MNVGHEKNVEISTFGKTYFVFIDNRYLTIAILVD